MKLYFDVRRDGRLIRDDAGVDLPNLRAALDTARSFVRRLVAQNPSLDLSGRVLEIRDPSGAIVVAIPFSEAIGEDTRAIPELMIHHPAQNRRGPPPKAG